MRSSTLAQSAAGAPKETAPVVQTRLALNLLYLLAGEFTAKLFTFATFSYLARTLGPRDYGFIEFTLAVMVFFSLPVDLGLGSYGAREIARNPDKAALLLREITGLRITLAIVSMTVLSIFILLVDRTLELKLLLALYGVSLFGGPFLLQWFFQAHDQMRWIGWASIVRQATFAGLIFLIRQHLGLDLPKDHPALHKLYEWMLAEFDNGRQTSIEWEEIAPIAQQLLGDPVVETSTEPVIQ